MSVPCLWVDPSNGAAGDMLLGALLDAGASLEVVRAAVAAVAPEPVQVALFGLLLLGDHLTPVMALAIAVALGLDVRAE